MITTSLTDTAPGVLSGTVTLPVRGAFEVNIDLRTVAGDGTEQARLRVGPYATTIALGNDGWWRGVVGVEGYPYLAQARPLDQSWALRLDPARPE